MTKRASMSSFNAALQVVLLVQPRSRCISSVTAMSPLPAPFPPSREHMSKNSFVACGESPAKARERVTSREIGIQGALTTTGFFLERRVLIRQVGEACRLQWEGG